MHGTSSKSTKKKGHIHLSAMQIVKGLKKGVSTFLATMENSGEENYAK